MKPGMPSISMSASWLVKLLTLGGPQGHAHVREWDPRVRKTALPQCSAVTETLGITRYTPSRELLLYAIGG